MPTMLAGAGHGRYRAEFDEVHPAALDKASCRWWAMMRVQFPPGGHPQRANALDVVNSFNNPF